MLDSTNGVGAAFFVEIEKKLHWFYEKFNQKIKVTQNKIDWFQRVDKKLTVERLPRSENKIWEINMWYATIVLIFWKGI